MGKRLRLSTIPICTILALSICLALSWRNSAYGAEDEPVDKLAWQKWHEPSFWKAKYETKERDSNLGIQVRIGYVIAEQGGFSTDSGIMGRIVLVAVAYDRTSMAYNLVLSIEKLIAGPMGTFSITTRTVEVPIYNKFEDRENTRSQVFVGNVINEDGNDRLTTIGANLFFFDYSPKRQTISVALITVPKETE